MDGNAPNPDRLETLALDDVDESITNPRKHFDAAKLAELADDLKANGLTQPVVVRPRPGGRYELVVGARRSRASKMAGFTTILAIVRDLSDREVLEKQLSENAQRQDVHPLEELDGYARLLDVHRATVEEVAARVGKPAGYVRHRLQYRALCDEAREAFFAGKLTPHTALLVARIPGEKLQMQAVAEITVPDWNGEVMGAQRAGDHVRGRYMLRLAVAPFDRSDAALVPAAGACTHCPKRTGHQPELFADVESPDTCTDPQCFGSKKDAHWKALAEKAKAKGGSVLAEKDAKKVFSYGGNVSRESDFVDLAEKAYQVGDGRKTYKGLLGEANVPPVTIARDTEGNVHELVKKTDLKKALKTAGVATKNTPSKDSKAQQAREKQAQQRAVVDAAIAQLVEAAEKKAPTDALWAYLAETFVRASWHDVLRDVVMRRDLRAPVKKGRFLTEEQLLTDAIKTMKPAAHRALVIEILATRGAVPGHYSGEKYGENMLGACTLYGINLAKIEASVEASHAAAKKAKRAKTSSAKGKPAASAGRAAAARSDDRDDESDDPVGASEGAPTKKPRATKGAT
jgi:ParB/RepB/Spo0J family partition protein